MPAIIDNLLGQYVELVRKIYGECLKSVILYGSYARAGLQKAIYISKNG